MANLNEICQAIVSDVQDGLACGVVDLNTGMLMGVHHTIPYFTQSYLDAIAAAAVELIRGRTVRRVEELMTKHRGSEVKDAFEEIFISSKTVFHFMALIKEKQSLVVLVTKKTASQGLGWVSLRGALKDISAALP
ncbi:hypothetical protein CSA56_12310 [candidate division KSB3 bacterium]|uniref:Roadblock/LAMTOR2 domain-containing protein n=1 Tax=candidate division KSB3 bacterium TaxID=2044937 RepID=A0A2G6KCG3_9BACT|nr:MAG: hypothetical protein CSA56_12310 [candidate division KSB3 bacterium]